MPVNPERVKTLADDAHLLRQLADQAGWKLLEQIFASKRETVLRQLLARDHPDVRSLDYNRGLANGIAWVLETPGKAEDRLEAAKKQAERLTTLQEQVIE
jgi:hypothetical protein